MSRLALNKSALNQEMQKLHLYSEFLPSLEMKRRQLMAERRRALSTLQADQQEEIDAVKRIGKALPMLSQPRLDLNNLITIESLEEGEERLLGITMPTLKSVQFKIGDYAYLVTPHWLENLQDRMKKAITLHLKIAVDRARLHVLNRAVQVISQRVNLFDKVLIPKTTENIRQIRIYLSDAERAAVVRAKIAKQKRGRAS